MKFKVYCARPISGCSWDEVYEYYTRTKSQLERKGFDVLHPMTGKKEIRTEIEEKFQPKDFKNEIASNHAIFERDRWMVNQCDILYINLVGCERVSIGSMMEIAWASMLGKYVILVMEDDNIHEHAFVVEAADVRFKDEETAMAYMKKLFEQAI